MIDKTVDLIADQDKINKFIESLPKHFNTNRPRILALLSNRPKDPVYVGYNQDYTKFCTSIDGAVWSKNYFGDLDLYGFVPIPERGTIWQARNSKALYIVTDFANLKSTNTIEEPPIIICMDEIGITKSFKVSAWHEKLMFSSQSLHKPERYK